MAIGLAARNPWAGHTVMDGNIERGYKSAPTGIGWLWYFRPPQPRHERLGEVKMKMVKTALFLALMSGSAYAQINASTQAPITDLPFTMTPVTTFDLPWRLAFLPDGRMLVTEKVGPIWLVSQLGEKIAVVGNTPPVYWQGQN